MYQLVKSYIKRDHRRGSWIEMDLADEHVATLSSKYASVLFVITYPALQGKFVHLYLKDVTRQVMSARATETVTTWFENLGQQTLPVRDGAPDFGKRYVKYVQAWHGGYSVVPVDRKARHDMVASKYDQPDLLITREDLDPVFLRKNAMFSINGFFHFAEYGDHGVYVHEGNHSIRYANDNQIGVHSFADVGEIDYINITEDMVTNLKEGEPLINGVYVTLPKDFDFENNTVLLVLGGYLQVLDNTYTRVGKYTYKIELSRLMLLERYYESREKIDLTALDFTEYRESPDLVSVSEWQSDHSIMTMLTLAQSFFVVVNTPSMFHELIPVESLELPGRFRDYEFHSYPLLGAYGKALEYHAIAEDGQYAIAAMNTIRHRYDFNRRPWRDSLAVNNGRNSAFPFTHADAFWRLIGTQE